MKFGGSSFKTPSHYTKLAKRLVRESKKAKLLVVVSGFPGITEDLRSSLRKVNPTTSLETSDGITILGDSIGAGLLRAALEKEGARTTSLMGGQIGIISDSTFSGGNVKKVSPEYLAKALESFDIVVVPGGQAVDNQGRPVWLGKNSSDLTAVLIAAAFKVKICEIFSDVDGVYSTDPNQQESAQLIKKLSYQQAINMSKAGAKVLHYGSVEVARENQVAIQCRSNLCFGAGTLISEMGSGPAVVYDQRSIVRQLESHSSLESAKAKLAPKVLPIHSVINDGIHYLALACGFRDFDEILKDHDIHTKATELKLITVFNWEGAQKYHLANENDAQEVSNSLHIETVNQNTDGRDSPWRFATLEEWMKNGT